MSTASSMLPRACGCGTWSKAMASPWCCCTAIPATSSVNGAPLACSMRLSGRYRVIALDQRGHGRSSKPHDPAAYGREMALDVVRLLDHLGVSRCARRRLLDGRARHGTARHAGTAAFVQCGARWRPQGACTGRAEEEARVGARGRRDGARAADLAGAAAVAGRPAACPMRPSWPGDRCCRAKVRTCSHWPPSVGPSRARW